MWAQSLTVDFVAAQQNVLRLQVQMGDLFAVQMLQSAQNLAHARLRLALGQRAILIQQRLQFTAGCPATIKGISDEFDLVWNGMYSRDWKQSLTARE